MVIRTPTLTSLAVQQTRALVYHWSLADFQRLLELEILPANRRFELISGTILEKTRVNPPHAQTVRILHRLLMELLADQVILSQDLPIELPSSDSMPQPDFSLLRLPESRYAEKHPGPKDILLIIEVSQSTLQMDRETMQSIYALDKIPVYWIINLPEKKVEVYTQPKGGKKPGYKLTQEYRSGQSIPVVLNQVEIGTIAVDAIFPRK